LFALSLPKRQFAFQSVVLIINRNIRLKRRRRIHCTCTRIIFVCFSTIFVVFSFFIIFYFFTSSPQHNTPYTSAHRHYRFWGESRFYGDDHMQVVLYVYLCVCEVHGEVMLAQQVHTHTHAVVSVYIYVYVTHTLAHHARIRYTHIQTHTFTHSHT